MTIKTIISALEDFAPVSLQEEYDNAGLIIGNPNWNCTGVLIALDCTEEVVQEALEKNCNLVIAHHPIVFKGLKKINGKNYIERTVINAIKNDVAVYACHTNADNVVKGVNGWAANLLEMNDVQVLLPKQNQIGKLVVYVPASHRDTLESALFDVGAGEIGKYAQCSFFSEGWGSFLPKAGADPYVGKVGVRTTEQEQKLEVLFPISLKNNVLAAMKSAHPYEEVAYEISLLDNELQDVGSGVIGSWPVALEEKEALEKIKEVFGLTLVRHTKFLGKKVQKIAFCGGSGSFLTGTAIARGADLFITADVKYHEFFDADQRILLADIGHFESERHTIDLFADVLRQKFPTFALLKSEVSTNPVNYFI